MDSKALTSELRKLGMTKAEFAVKLGVSRVTVYQWREVPDYAQLVLALLGENARQRAVIDGLLARGHR